MMLKIDSFLFFSYNVLFVDSTITSLFLLIQGLFSFTSLLQHIFKKSSPLSFILQEYNQHLNHNNKMPFELGAKKAGLSLVRAFLHSVEGASPAFSQAVRKRNSIGYKFKAYRDGKIVSIQAVQSIEDAFPCKGDKK